MRVHSGARVVHEYDWCTRVCSGARVVHDITEQCTSTEWCTRKSLVDWAWNLQEKQLLLSEAGTRAAGGGEVKTGEEELIVGQVIPCTWIACSWVCTWIARPE